jgi:Leucine-rich repeat (LRR) protein
MKIIVTYIPNSLNITKEYKSFEEIENNDSVIEIYCHNNNLTFLPENMNFPNLEMIDCSNNNLTVLPENMIFPNLQSLYCQHNKLKSLPHNMIYPNLHTLICNNNMLTTLPENINILFPNLYTLSCDSNMLLSLPENMNFNNLIELHCQNNNLRLLPENINAPILRDLWIYNNKLTSLPKNINHYSNLKNLCFSNNMISSLPENIHLQNLIFFDCSRNILSSLPENMIFPNLNNFVCCNNMISSLPLCIMNFVNIKHIYYDNNIVELSPQIARFINRLEHNSLKKINVYNDMENIHNSNIQLSVKDSINRLTTRMDVKKYNLEELNNIILDNMILTEKSKSLLLEYICDTSVHSLLLLTFSEVLWFVLQTITTDFNTKEQEEILNILNQEILDTYCKCFTGRMNRIVNSLNGFSHMVSINIKDNEQISNIIILVKNKLERNRSYTIEKHTEIVKKELLERDYDSETIKTWLEYINEDAE